MDAPDVGMWRRYEIGTLPIGTIEALLALAWALAERLERRPTAEEILKAVRGRPTS